MVLAVSDACEKKLTGVGFLRGKCYDPQLLHAACTALVCCLSPEAAGLDKGRIRYLLVTLAFCRGVVTLKTTLYFVDGGRRRFGKSVECVQMQFYFYYI